MMPGYNEDLRFEYDLTPDSVVLDVGGYLGDWADKISRKYGCMVHVLEPVSEFYRGLVNRFAGNPLIKVYNFGLGADNGTADFGIQHDSTGEFAGSPKRETVQIRGIEGVMREIGGDLALLKLNAEGAEWRIVPALISSGLISRVSNLQLQWHPVGNGTQELFDVLQRSLSLTHRLTFDNDWVWQNWLKK